MAMELVLIETDSCASCTGLEQEIQVVLSKYPRLELHIVRNQSEAQAYIDRYPLEKLPALLLISQNQVVGHLYGYQPAFILDLWLDHLVKEGK